MASGSLPLRKSVLLLAVLALAHVVLRMLKSTDPQGRKVLQARVDKLRDMVRKEHNVLGESRIRESWSSGVAFQEQGQDTVSQDPKGQKKKNRTYLVTIIEEGMGNSKDKNFYSGEALVKGAKLFNGTKAYADHPDAISEKTLPERSMKDLVGWYSNCVADKNPTDGKARVRGKLHFFPAAKWLTDMIDTILTDPTAKGLFGISINAIGKTRPAHSGGDMINYVESFQRVDSADVVTEPAARGKFEKILESRGGVRSRMATGVTSSMSTKRMREAGIQVSPKAIKKLADSATAAYHSDNPDEMKQALYDIQKELYPLSSISGKGPGQSNEEQYSNVNPAGGSTMKKVTKPVRASSGGGRRLIRKKKRFTHEADGTGPDNENLEEPDPGDTASQIKEADAEDEEGSELGDIEDYGDSSKMSKHSEAAGNGNRRRRVATREDEGMEGFEDEGMEGLEDEGAEDGMGAGGGSAGAGGAMPSPSSAGPGSSRMVTADDGVDEGASSDDDGSDDDDGIDDDLGEAEEDESLEGMEDESLEDETMEARRPSRNRPRLKTREASLSGGLGKSGRSSLPSYAGGSEDYGGEPGPGKRDRSTSGTGKSYKIKTSVGRQNKPVSQKFVKKLVHEANRRIELLEKGNLRLRESVRGKERVIGRYQGIISFHNSKVSAKRLLESAVTKNWFDEGFARAIEPKLYGMNKPDQIQEIKVFARLRESAAGAAVEEVRMLEGVEGVGARGGAVSSRSTVDRDSELAEAMAGDGIPFREEE